MRVKIFLVGKGPVCELEADVSIKVIALKQRVTSEIGIPVGAHALFRCFSCFLESLSVSPPSHLQFFRPLLDQQSLFYAGKRLADDKSLSDSDLPAKSDVVTLLLMTVRPFAAFPLSITREALDLRIYPFLGLVRTPPFSYCIVPSLALP